jgi:hypothetical protein
MLEMRYGSVHTQARVAGCFGAETRGRLGCSRRRAITASPSGVGAVLASTGYAMVRTQVPAHQTSHTVSHSVISSLSFSLFYRVLGVPAGPRDRLCFVYHRGCTRCRSGTLTAYLLTLSILPTSFLFRTARNFWPALILYNPGFVLATGTVRCLSRA